MFLFLFFLNRGLYWTASQKSWYKPNHEFGVSLQPYCSYIDYVSMNNALEQMQQKLKFENCPVFVIFSQMTWTINWQ